MSAEGDTVKLAIGGDFAFTANDLFAQLLARYPGDRHAFDVDLQQVDALDSSALGLLLRLRAHSRNGDSLTISRISDTARASLASSPLGAMLRVAP